MKTYLLRLTAQRFAQRVSTHKERLVAYHLEWITNTSLIGRGVDGVHLQGTRSGTVTEEEAKSTSSEDEDDEEEDAVEEAESPLAPRTTRQSNVSPASLRPRTAVIKGRHRLRKAA